MLNMERAAGSRLYFYNRGLCIIILKNFSKNMKQIELKIHFDIIHPGKDKNDAQASGGTLSA
jgi:hypothetical protein